MSGKNEKKCVRRKIQYSKDSLKKAVAAVQEGMTLRKASLKFGVPRSTLRSKINHLYPNERPGPPSILSPEQEEELVDWIIKSSNIGRPVSKSQLINSVSLIVNRLNIPNPFNEKGPGRSWYKSFLRRHEEIVVHMAKRSKNSTSDADLETWHSTIAAYLKENNLENLGSERIWTTSEVELLLNPTPKKDLTDDQKEKEADKLVKTECDKDNLTVLVTGNAAGELAPPLILFDDENLPDSKAMKMPPGWSYTASKESWEDGRNFYDYISNVFFPFIKNKLIELPLILYIDGNASRLTQPLTEFCQQNKIVLISLNADSNNPMNQVFFKPLKIAWENSACQYNQDNQCLTVNKFDVAQTLKKTFDAINKIKILSSGFRNCGLYPFSSNVIKHENKAKRFECKKSAQEEAEDQANRSYFHTVLQCIEDRIEPNRLKVFRSAVKNSQWTGAVEDTNLFYLWRNIFQASNTPLQTNLLQEKIEIIDDDSSYNDISLNGSRMDFDFAERNCDTSSRDEDMQDVSITISLHAQLI